MVGEQKMKVLEHFKVPTGDILIVEGQKGKLEMLSIGDYGKDVNLTHQKVTHQPIMPLTEKWVIPWPAGSFSSGFTPLI